MSKINQDIYFCWACDFSYNTGEGLLGREFIKYFKKKNKCKVNIIKNKKIKIIKNKYINPFFGILILWYFFLRNKKIIYLNYLPLWNSFIFFFLPPKTILGPITGGANFDGYNKINFFIRKNFFPLFYKISEYLILLRFKNLIFSTDLLKKYLNVETIKKSKFNFVFKIIKTNNKRYIKDNKFLIYNRNHKNKSYHILDVTMKKLINLGFKIEVIGDKIKMDKVINYGFISHKKVLKLLKKTKYSIVSTENVFSLFTIDCINNQVKLLIHDKNYALLNYYKKYFIKYNANSSLKKLINN